MVIMRAARSAILFRCVRSDAQRWPRDLQAASTQRYTLRRVSRRALLLDRLGIEVLEVKFMGQDGVYGASTGYLRVRDIVACTRAGQRRGRPAKRRLAENAL